MMKLDAAPRLRSVAVIAGLIERKVPAGETGARFLNSDLNLRRARKHYLRPRSLARTRS